MQISHIALTNTTDLSVDVTGVILAGGRSRRMGQDKATLVINGEPIFARTLRVLQQVFLNVLIAGERPDLVVPGVHCVADIFPGSALGGIHAGLTESTTPWVFVAPCDLPYPNAQLIHYLLTCRKGYDIVVPRTGTGLEPVFALYHKKCLSAMEEMLARGDYRIYDFYDQFRVCYVDMESFPANLQRALCNINTPEDLRRLGKETL